MRKVHRDPGWHVGRRQHGACSIAVVTITDVTGAGDVILEKSHPSAGTVHLMWFLFNPYVKQHLGRRLAEVLET